MKNYDFFHEFSSLALLGVEGFNTSAFEQLKT